MTQLTKFYNNSNIDQILDRSGPYNHPDFFEPGQSVKDFLREICKVLVIGAGGLGCEILQNLAMLGFGDVHVIDMDTIDLSNLNRQFLFREKDIGRPKSIVAAEFINRRITSCKVTPHHCKIQDKEDSFYLSFNIIICGLDSVQARRWINSTLFNLFDQDDPKTMIPLIDGGTEGFKGQSRVILPYMTSCYECSLEMLTPQTKFPICTIANTPRLPEHCIEWASVLEWPKVFKDLKLDGDNPDHIQWLFDQASNRAKTFSIEGVTWSLTQGVVKNIIPAIASTNAIIAASCCNEAFKIATNSAPFLQNYMMYTGNDSVYTFTFKHERKPDCQVCGDSDKDPIRLDVSKSSTLEELIDLLIESPNFQLKHPSISRAKDREPIYFQNPEQLRLLTELNLEKSLEELFTCKGVEDEKRMVIDKGDNDEEELYENNLIVVTDVTLPFSMKIQLKLN